MQTIKYLNKAKSLYKTIEPTAKGYVRSPLATTGGSVKFILSRAALPTMVIGGAANIIGTKGALDKDIDAQIKSDNAAYKLQMKKIWQDRARAKSKIKMGN